MWCRRKIFKKKILYPCIFILFLFILVPLFLLFFFLSDKTNSRKSKGESLINTSTVHSLFCQTYSTFFFPPPPAKLSTAMAKKTLSRMSDHRN